FEPWWSGWLLMPSYGGWLGGGAVCPLCRETASSEAEIGHPLEGRSAVLERGGDWPPAQGQVRCPRARRRCVCAVEGPGGSPRARRRRVTRSRVDPLPSSEAEIVRWA